MVTKPASICWDWETIPLPSVICVEPLTTPSGRKSITCWDDDTIDDGNCSLPLIIPLGNWELPLIIPLGNWEEQLLHDAWC